MPNSIPPCGDGRNLRLSPDGKHICSDCPDDGTPVDTCCKSNPAIAAQLGQPVIIENRPGAGSNIGAETVAKAAADGYTLLMASPPLTINPALYKKLPFDPRRDLAPVSLLGQFDLAVLVPEGLFTARLRSMQVGDSLQVEHENYGFMTADRFSDGEDCWMLATGTGIGPYISMLRDPVLWTRFERLVLVHGVKHQQQIEVDFSDIHGVDGDYPENRLDK